MRTTTNRDFSSDVITKLVPHSVEETLRKLKGLLDAMGLKLFAVIDQRAEARAVGLKLRATTLVIFGSPASGTPVMESEPLAALDLPLKVLIWSDGDQTKVSYVTPAALATRYHLSRELATNLTGIESLTSALVTE